MRPSTAPVQWIEAAQDRQLWESKTQEWLSARGWHATKAYQDLTIVDLEGRMVRKTGEYFQLLPMRHPPVEEPYPCSYQEIAAASDDSQDCALTVSCDGSSKDKLGAFGVVLLPTYGDLDKAVLASGRVPGECTNIRAEIRAAVQALRMIRELTQVQPSISVELQTDSLFVIRLLSDAFLTPTHARDVAQLLDLWNQTCPWTQLRHVRGHRGNVLNSIADATAKRGLSLPAGIISYRTFDTAQAVFARDGRLPPFVNWML